MAGLVDRYRASYIRTKAERRIQLVSQDKECCSSEESEESGKESVEDQLFQNLYENLAKGKLKKIMLRSFWSNHLTKIWKRKIFLMLS